MAPAVAERPASKGASLLSVSGNTPPSRSGATRSGSGTRTGRTSGSAVDALTQALIKKLRERFGEVAKDVKSQEIIANEVNTFMAKGGSVREDDLASLEDRIRSRLAGDTPLRNTLAVEKRALTNADEWAKIYSYQIQEGLAKEKAKREVAKLQQEELKAVLETQLKEAEAKKKAEHDEEIAYYEQEQAAYKKWEAEEEAKKKLQHDIMEKLKQDREAQLADRQMRKSLALDKRAKEEADLAAKIAFDTKAEFESEEHARLEAKKALKEFLLSNEVNKRIKEEEKAKSWSEDQRYMREFAEILNKQEAARKVQLEKLKAIQARQAEEAGRQPEAKAWIDPAIIERYYREAEEAAEREEKRRQDLLAGTTKKVAASLKQQMEERDIAKAEARRIEQERAQQMLSRLHEQDEKEKAAKLAVHDKKAKLKAEIEAQMKANAARKRVMPMSETEKLINTQLLKQTEQFQLTGKIA